jgi:hypothetical protein
LASSYGLHTVCFYCCDQGETDAHEQPKTGKIKARFMFACIYTRMRFGERRSGADRRRQ